MTDPTAPDDDNWNELARELGLDDPPRPAAPDDSPFDAENPNEPGEPGEYDDASLTDTVGEGADTDAEEADGEADGESESQPGDEQPGPGRKRRRRRRRRKKGGPGGEPVAEGEPVAAAADEPEDQPTPMDRPGHLYEEPGAEVEDEAEAEAVETGGVPPAAEEDTGSEVLRELIATWSVPSWDDIVAGLYRPER